MSLREDMKRQLKANAVSSASLLRLSTTKMQLGRREKLRRQLSILILSTLFPKGLWGPFLYSGRGGGKACQNAIFGVSVRVPAGW